MFGRVDMLLNAPTDGALDQLLQAVEREATALRATAPAGTAVRVATRLQSTGAAPVAAGQTDASTSTFDVVLSIGASDRAVADLVAPLGGLAARLGGAVDTERSGAIAGHVEVVLPGDGPIFTLYPLRRVDGMTSAEFHDHWLHRHGSLAREVPGLRGYRQFHGDPADTVTAARLAGVTLDDFEGAAEGRRASEQAVALPRGPELEAVLADEKNFIDVARCGPAMYRAVSGAEGFGG